MLRSTGLLIGFVLILSSSDALAQPAGAPPPAAPEVDKDGARFRGGVSAVAGGMFLNDYSGIMGGVDGRLGAQVTDMIGVYAVPHLTFGPVKVDVGPTSASTVIGLFSATAVAEATLIDHIFVGGGGGYGIVNNPSGPVMHFRAGGYPLMGYGDDGIRRKGLMLGVDARFYFLEGITVMEVSGGIGYEAF